MEFDEFAGWFSGYSAAWVEVLKKSDAQLGLSLAGGKEGGYRDLLIEMVKKWETETNDFLKDLDEFAMDNSKARVRIFSDGGSSDDEDQESENEEN